MFPLILKRFPLERGMNDSRMFDTELKFMKQSESDIGFQLRLTNNSVKNYVDGKCQKNLANHLTGIQGLTIGYIYDHQEAETTSQDIMKAFDLKKAAVSQALSNLVEKGFVTMKPSNEDRRIKILTLTPAGINAHLEFMVVRDSTKVVIENGLSDEERQTFKAICEKVRNNVGGEK